MSARTEEIRRLAKEVAEGSIIAQATERLIYQIVEVCAEHEKTNLIEVVNSCVAIARSEDDGAGTEADNRARRIADRIANEAYETGEKPAPKAS